MAEMRRRAFITLLGGVAAWLFRRGRGYSGAATRMSAIGGRLREQNEN